MNNLSNMILFLVATTIGVFLLSIPKAQSVSASAQAEAMISGEITSAQSFAEIQEGSASASSTTSSTEKVESAATASSSDTYVSVPATISSHPLANQETAWSQEPAKSESKEDVTENKELSEISSLLKQNNEKLENAEQKLNSIEERQVKLLKMFILNLAIIALVVSLEIILVLKSNR